MGRSGTVAVAALLLLAVGPLGCSKSDATIDAERAAASRRPGDAGIVPRSPIREEIRPVTAAGAPLEFAETTYADGNPTHYADGSPTYHADGTPIDYRPRNIQCELRDMSTVFIRDVGQPRLGFEGSQASPDIEYLPLTDEAQVLLQGDPNVVWKDPQTGDTCWRALTCENPACVRQDEAPYIFAASGPGVLGDAPKSLRCPRCGRAEGVTKYFPAVTANRMAALRTELARLRAERANR